MTPPDLAPTAPWPELCPPGKHRRPRRFLLVRTLIVWWSTALPLTWLLGLWS